MSDETPDDPIVPQAPGDGDAAAKIGTDPAATRVVHDEVPAAADGGPAAASDGAAAIDRPRMELAQLEAIVEALVYASPEPLTPKMLMKLLSDEPKEDVQAALEALRLRYDRPGGLHLAQVAGGFQITTRPELHDWVRRLFHERSAQK